MILPQLQPLLDEGWEPITEVGPAAFRVGEFHRLTTVGYVIVGALCLTILLAPLGFMIWAAAGNGVEASEFRVALRRQVHSPAATNTV